MDLMAELADESIQHDTEGKVCDALGMNKTLKKRAESLKTLLTSNEDELEELRTTFRSNPRLVCMESSSAKFLCAEDGDSKRALASMNKYWIKRKRYFGKSCCLPLILSGKGALNNADEEVYKSGFIVNLPNDAQGRSVVCYDRSLLEKDFSDDLSQLLPSILRCVLYVLSNAHENPMAAKKGVVVIFVHDRTFSPMQFDKRFLKGFFEVADCFPFASLETITISVTPRNEDPVLDPALVHRELKELGSDRCNVMQHVSKRVLCSMLVKIGLEASGVPSSIGGKWGYFSHFRAYCRERVVNEELAEASITGSLTKANATEILERDAAKKRKRELDVVYARRKRQKTSSHKKELTDSVKKLKTKHRDLRAESKRLESLLMQASRAITNHVQNQTRLSQPRFGSYSEQTRRPSGAFQLSPTSPFRPTRFPLKSNGVAPEMMHRPSPVLGPVRRDSAMVHTPKTGPLVRSPSLSRPVVSPLGVSPRLAFQRIDKEIMDLLLLKQDLSALEQSQRIIPRAVSGLY